MEASCHPVSGTRQYGSPHHLEGQWAGRYSKKEKGIIKGKKDPPQVILVHRVDGKPSVLFGTKLRGDKFIGDDCITFWFESDNKSTGDTLVGQGRYAAPDTAPTWVDAELKWHSNDAFTVAYKKSPKDYVAEFTRLRFFEAADGETMIMA